MMKERGWRHWPTLGEPIITTFLFIVPEEFFFGNSVLFSSEDEPDWGVRGVFLRLATRILPGSRGKEYDDR